MVPLTNKGSAEISLCWEKLDSKTKKINFLITSSDGDADVKATVQTVDTLAEKI